jgi:hypothetical protein
MVLKPTTPEELDEINTDWQTETGLPNDIDAWIVNARFGTPREEYTAKVAQTSQEAPVALIVDLEDENGEIVGSQGYSVGTGWEVSEDGLSITHPKRKNVVGSSMYGQLQTRVTRDLKVPMGKFGKPTDANSWNGLGFHWMLEEHPTIRGQAPKQGIIPTVYLGRREPSKVAKAAAGVRAGKPAVTSSLVEKRLVDLIKEKGEIKAFQLAAIRIAEVASNDTLMSQILDEGPEGYWATHQ